MPRPSKDSRTLELFRRSASKKEDKYRTRHLIRHNHTYSMSIYSLVSTRVMQEDATTNASNTYRQRQKADVWVLLHFPPSPSGGVQYNTHRHVSCTCGSCVQYKYFIWQASLFCLFNFWHQSSTKVIYFLCLWGFSCSSWWQDVRCHIIFLRYLSCEITWGMWRLREKNKRVC